MDFLTYVEFGRAALSTYLQVGRENLLRIVQVKDKVGYILGDDSLRPIFEASSSLERTDMYLLTRVFGNGPRIFKPTVKQLHLLSQMNLNLKATEYTQPFETLVVQLPDSYDPIRNPLVGNTNTMYEQKSTHKPLFCVVNKNEVVIIFSILFDSRTQLTSWMPISSEFPLEEWVSMKTPALAPNSLAVTDEEEMLSMELRRTILSYCLLTDEIGIKVEPNKQKEQLLKLIQKNNKHKEANILRYRLTPTYYTLAESVKLYHTADSLPSGVIMSPHLRRGHFRQQHYGPANSLMRRIRIWPVFVNEHLLLGD